MRQVSFTKVKTFAFNKYYFSSTDLIKRTTTNSFPIAAIESYRRKRLYRKAILDSLLSNVNAKIPKRTASCALECREQLFDLESQRCKSLIYRNEKRYAGLSLKLVTKRKKKRECTPKHIDDPLPKIEEEKTEVIPATQTDSKSIMISSFQKKIKNMFLKSVPLHPSITKRVSATRSGDHKVASLLIKSDNFGNVSHNLLSTLKGNPISNQCTPDLIYKKIRKEFQDKYAKRTIVNQYVNHKFKLLPTLTNFSERNTPDNSISHIMPPIKIKIQTNKGETRNKNIVKAYSTITRKPKKGL